MNKIPYKLTVLFLCIGLTVSNAQKFEKKINKEITTKGDKVSLVANYADIEIVEWNKNKIKMEAVMTVEGATKEEAQSYFDSWKVGLDQKPDGIHIVSKSNNHSRTSHRFEHFNFEMPEISIESLGVLDSIDFSFPEVNFKEIFNDSTFNTIYTHDFSLDSLGGNFDFEKLKENQEYLKEWQEANKENFIKLQKKAALMAKRNKMHHKRRVITAKKRAELARKRGELAKKRGELARKRSVIARKRVAEARKRGEAARKRHKKIRAIIKNRNKAKVRTKLIIKVPKGTSFNMNVNYSKISTN